jgi:hypothetical protein
VVDTANLVTEVGDNWGETPFANKCGSDTSGRHGARPALLPGTTIAESILAAGAAVCTGVWPFVAAGATAGLEAEPFFPGP